MRFLATVLRLGAALAAASCLLWLPPVPRPAQTVVIVVANVAAGVAIARWWAPLIVFWPLVIAATESPGTEDTRWGVIGMVAVPVTMEAVLILAGVLAAKIIAAAVWRDRRPSGAGAHP